MSLTMAANQTVHLWEAEGYGKAPFHCLGVASLPPRSLLGQNPDAYNRAMAELPKGFRLGFCHICGTPLVNNYLIEDANGHHFAVGSECVNKAGDKGLVDAIKAHERQRQKEQRQARSEQQRQAREAKIVAAYDAQRARNGGLTDDELFRKQIAELKEEKIALLSELANTLFDGKGGFRDSITNDLNKGNIPTGRGYNLMVDILAKQAGRKNSAAYKAEAQRVEKVLEQARKLDPKITEIDQKRLKALATPLI